MTVRIINGDCRSEMASLAASGVRVHAVVTDPPYHLTTGKKGGTGAASLNPNSPAGRSRIGTGFMGKVWDGGDIAFQPDTWRAAFDLMLPGAHLVAFGGTRQWHRMACAIEDAGFEIRDNLAWVYGSGFPKSMDVGKALPEWAGWGTALKPAFEPIVLARKPLAGTVAGNVLAHGCGGLNIDACRIAAPDGVPIFQGRDDPTLNTFGNGLNGSNRTGEVGSGRWPANLIHDGSEEVEAAFAAFGEKTSGSKRGGQYGRDKGVHDGGQRQDGVSCFADSGSASRFFYTAKADAADRAGSKHPTVKPTNLMRWLVQLITPPGGTVLDPFAGSGSTGLAADQLGFNAILIEQDATFVDDIRRKINADAGMFAGLL